MDVSKTPDGVYAAVTWSSSTKDRIKKIMDSANIPNPLDVDKIHTTLIYSRKWADIEVIPTVRYVAYPVSYEKWQTQSGKTALVMKLESPEISERHKQLMDTYDLTYDYPEFKAHITLSYDIPEDFDESPLSYYLKELVCVTEGEYKSNLELDWADKNS